MPSAEAHLTQYNSNRQVLSELMNLDSQPNDWVITVAFYSALHIVGKAIAENIGQEFQSHQTRNKFIETNKMFESIAAEYIAMYTESRRARYHCANIKQKTVTRIIKQLEHIEQEMLA